MLYRGFEEDTAVFVQRFNWWNQILKCNTLPEGNARKWERNTNTCSQKAV